MRSGIVLRFVRAPERPVSRIVSSCATKESSFDTADSTSQNRTEVWWFVGEGNHGEMDTEWEIRLRRSNLALSAASLRKLHFFDEVEDDELRTQAAASSSGWNHFRRHVQIAGPTDEGSPVYIIAEGTVGVGVTPWAGRPYIGILFSAGEIFSLSDLPPHLREYMEAQAMSDSVVVY